MRYYCLLALLALPALGQEPAPSPSPEVSAFKLDIAAGGIVSLASAADTATSPTAIIYVEAPVARSLNAPRIQARTVLAALPGETLDLAKPETYRSLEFSLRVAWSPAEALLFSVYGEAGFATRLPGITTPRDRTARWAGAGIAFDRGESGRGWLSVGGGLDQRLDGSYQPAAHVAGYVALWAAGPASDLKGGQVRLAGEALLGLNFGQSGRSSRRDVVRLGIVVGVSR